MKIFDKLFPHAEITALKLNEPFFENKELVICLGDKKITITKKDLPQLFYWIEEKKIFEKFVSETKKEMDK